MDWDRLKLYHGCTIVDDIFCRTPIVDKMYKEHSKDKNLNEYIYKMHIHSNLFILLPNIFPYDLKDNIRHYVLWFNPKYYMNRENIILDKLYLNNIVRQRFPNNDYVYIVNSDKYKSVKEIYHIHVFIRISYK
jgi:hypothetical protein